MLKEFSIAVDALKTVRNPVFTVNTNDLNTLKLSITINEAGAPVNLSDYLQLESQLKNQIENLYSQMGLLMLKLVFIHLF
ncbi:hypothetical protein [Peribacillus butanolivorans]